MKQKTIKPMLEASLMDMHKQALLVLADGAVFRGMSAGADGICCGEVIFNTSQTGYQEILTDPSYAEQIIVFTQPHIGNVGVNKEDDESEKIWASGAIIQHITKNPSNWRSEQSLPDFFLAQNKIVISGIDTRALTLHLRNKSSMAGCIMAGNVDVQKALSCAQSWSGMNEKDLAKTVTTPYLYSWIDPKPSKNSAKGYQIVVIDYGVKYSILRELAAHNCYVTVVPANTAASDILALKPDGILLSNGPGDPKACDYAITTIKKLLVSGIPMFGICLGHQLLGLASGLDTEKMTFGHHGANHPIQCLKTQRVFISSQNHGFVLSDSKFPPNIEVTHRSLFDNSIAGICLTGQPVFSFQGHPEAGPGPTELRDFFLQFIELVEKEHAKKN